MCASDRRPASRELVPKHSVSRASGVIRFALALLLSAPVGPAAAASLHEPIAPQPLADALVRLAEQTDAFLMYDAVLAEGLCTQGAPQGASLEEALSVMLDGTGLIFELADGRYLVIRRDARHPDRPLGPGPLCSSSDVALSSPKAAHPKTELTTVIIGTHSDKPPAGVQYISMSRADMNRRGYATVQEVLRGLPQNFSGGPSEDTWAMGQEELFNVSRGTGANLRGLGAGSTLVLLNGRRLAAGGGDGRFVDLSAIPLAAVDHIEVLPDGASAVYGADAVGGVINVQLRGDYEGRESQVRWGEATSGNPSQRQLAQTWGGAWDSGNALISAEYYDRGALGSAERRQSRSSDLRSLGGENFDVPEGNPGTLITPSGTWRIPLGQNGRALTAADLIAGPPHLYNGNVDRDLLPDHRRYSLVGTLDQRFGNATHLFVDVLLSQRHTQVMAGPARTILTVPSSNPFYVNPEGGTEPISVAYSFGRDFEPEVDHATVTTRSISTGIHRSIRHWKLSSAFSYASYQDHIDGGPIVDSDELAQALEDSNPETAFNPFGDGTFTNRATLARIRVNARLERKADLGTVNLNASRALPGWYAGDVDLALGLEARNERLASFGQQGQTITADLHASRSVYAGYTELTLPFVNEHNRRVGLEGLRLTLAGRYEQYSEFNNSGLMPRIGLTWSVVPVLSLRGTWSTSFKAPSLIELDESRNFTILNLLADSTAPAGFSPVLLQIGNNTDLREETARTRTVGVDLKLPQQGLSIELTHFNLNYRDRVDRIDFNSMLLEDPAFADLVTRNPSEAQRQEVCTRGRFIGNVEDCLNTPIAALLDLRLDNIAFMKTAGFDALVSYQIQGEEGRIQAGLNATYVTDFSIARYRSSPLSKLIDTAGYPLRFRGKGEILLERGPLSTIGVVNYAGRYTDRISAPSRRVHSWMTFDLGMRYRMGGNVDEGEKGTTFGITAQNVFDKRPPFLNNPLGIGYDPENADLLGRFLSLHIQRGW
jgi:iron complex outermembrane recepter protein